MDQIDFQGALGYSAPVLFDGQNGDDPALSLTPACDFYWSDPIATNDPSQAVDLTYDCPLSQGFVQPRSGDSEQSLGASLSPTSSAGFSGFIQPHGAGLPSSTAYIGSEQSLDANMSPTSYVDFSGYVQSRGVCLPSNLAYTDSGQSPSASLLFNPANCAGSSVFVQPPSAYLPSAYTDFGQSPSPANNMSFSGFAPPPTAGLPSYTDFGPSPDTSLPLCPANHIRLSGSVPPPTVDLPSSLAYTDFGLSPGASVLLSPANYTGSSSFVSPPTAGLYLSRADLKRSSGTSLGLNHANYQSCVRCRQQKKKCIMDSSDRGSCCSPCAQRGIPASVCIVVTLITPFIKCLEKKYPLRHTSIQASGFRSSKTVQLGHYPNGPILTVECCQFRPTDKIQTYVLRKNQHGCHSMGTTAWCLKNPIIDISPYLQECVPYSMAEACSREHPQLSPFFKLARDCNDNEIIELCWLMFTIIRLLRLGWAFSGNESLGMVTVTQENSVFYGFKHVPRMLRDQLNHALELKMMELDTRILKSARDILENGKRSMWVIGYLVLFFLLHVREVYAGRLLIWRDYYTELAEFWLHTSSPTVLINEVIASCNSILSLFRFSAGPKHLLADLNDPKNRVDVDSDFVKSMRKLQIHALQLRTDGFIGRMACKLYKAGDPNSVDLTVCLLIFESTEKGYEVKGFY